MKFVALVCCAPLVVTLAGCSQRGSEAGVGPPESYQATVEAEVAQTIRDFFAGFSKATCTDGSAVSRFASDPTLYVDDTEVVDVSLTDYEAGVRQRACRWRSHGGGVDSVRVSAFGPDAAMAAWTYHDDIVLKTGDRRQTRGAVLMTLVKKGSKWLITASKTTEIESR